jgi:hypothetical protein
MAEHPNNRRIAFLVPDGIGVRNYLFSKLPACFHQELLLFHHLPVEVLEEVDRIHPGKFTNHRTPAIAHSRWFEGIRQILSAAFYHKAARISGGRKLPYLWPFISQWPRSKRLKFFILSAVGHLVSYLPVLQEIMETALRRHMRNGRNANELRSFLNRHNPSAIVCTHQRSVEGGYLMEVAKSLKIQTIAIIFSWDNLSKSRITFQPDYCLVWSQWMKNEWFRFYPLWPKDKVFVTGTPQFDFHFDDELLWSRQTFAREFSANPNAIYFCFSGNEPSFPSDHLYLQDLLKSLHLLNPSRPVQVIVRPSPNDHTGRLKQVCDQYGELAVWAPPAWNRIGDRDWESNYPRAGDNQNLANLVYHCEAVIHCGSTMALDFAQRDKPACYIAYQQPSVPGFDLTIGYEQHHFKSLLDLDAVIFIRNKEAWTPLITGFLNGSDMGASHRLIWRNRITDNIRDAPERIANTIKEFCNKSSVLD